MRMLGKIGSVSKKQTSRFFSTTRIVNKRHCCKVLVIGGGAGGCSIAARFSKILHKNEIIVVEPQPIHFYKPYFILIGAGVKKLRDAIKPMLHVLPSKVLWLKNSVKHFCPNSNTVILQNEDIVEYDFMVISIGLIINYDEVSGLEEALENYRNVTTIYSPKYVEKTFKCLKEFSAGVVLFTSPETPISCASAPYQICLLAQDYFRKKDKISVADITFATASDSLFPVEIYSKTLCKIMQKRKIDIHLDTNLAEVIPENQKAVFECVNQPGNKICLKYSMLHVTPPMSIPSVLRDCKQMVDRHKCIDVDQYTLKHKRYSNVYALGDCISSEITKTTNAIGPQSYVVFKNICNALDGKSPDTIYTGYSACPIITSYSTAMLAEYDYSLKPLPTLPIKSNVERSWLYFMQTDITDKLYWHLLLRGLWDGPEFIRSFIRLKFVKSSIKNLLSRPKK